MADTTGMGDLRAETISRVVTGFALQEYVLKQLCMIQSSNAWTETYYAETATDLTGGAGSAVSGVPRVDFGLPAYNEETIAQIRDEQIPYKILQQQWIM